MSPPEPPAARPTSRIDTFVDAAFAFAVTLLVISVGSVPSSLDELREAFKSVPAFAISFALIGLFWLQHHRWSQRFAIDNKAGIGLSMLLVFLVLVYVYPLRIMADSLMHVISGGWLPAGLELRTPADLVFVYTAYGLGFASLSATLCALYAQGWRQMRQQPPAACPPVEREEILSEMGSLGVMALVGLASAALSLLLPTQRWSWLLLLPGLLYNLLFLLPWWAPRWARRRIQRDTALQALRRRQTESGA